MTRTDQTVTNATTSADSPASLSRLLQPRLTAGAGAELALRWRGEQGGRLDLSLTALDDLAGRWAALLQTQGIAEGEAVAVMTGRRPDTIPAALGLWRIGAVYCPLFADLGPDPVLARLQLGEVTCIITDADSYRRSVLPVRAALPRLRTVVIVGPACPPDCLSADLLLPAQSPDACAAARCSDDPLRPVCIHFTSGTTAPHASGGQPKAVRHDGSLLPRIIDSAAQALALAPGDLLWCTGEPGWVTHTIYGLIAPLAAGAACLIDAAPPSPTRCLSVLEDEPVSVWYTTPTVIRGLIGGGCAPARNVTPRTLRLALSVGEPLSADAVAWGEKALGVPFRDSWWQTETGAIVLSHAPGQPPRPGSMGQAQAGMQVAVMRRQEDGPLLAVSGADATGELAVHHSSLPRWSSVGGESAALPEDLDGWHLSGDMVRRDQDGYFWFLGRDDEVIKCAARMVGPFEIEAVLMEHPAVAECGVVGAPDPQLHEHSVAFIALQPGFEEGDSLRRELADYAAEHLGPALMPQEIRFAQTLPRTPSGKIIRRLLKGWL